MWLEEAVLVVKTMVMMLRHMRCQRPLPASTVTQDYASIMLQSRENLNLAQSKLQILSRLLTGRLHAVGSYMYLYCVLGQ